MGHCEPRDPEVLPGLTPLLPILHSCVWEGPQPPTHVPSLGFQTLPLTSVSNKEQNQEVAPEVARLLKTKEGRSFFTSIPGGETAHETHKGYKNSKENKDSGGPPGYYVSSQ